MIFGVDSLGNRIDAEYADRNGKYFCPGCKSKLVLKRGEILIPHFAHEKHSACDLFTENKMTEWHIWHQAIFGKQFREVCLSRDGVKHIADIKIGGTIIEFQHSPISNKVFEERTKFYRKYGKVIWVFDMTEKECWRRCDFTDDPDVSRAWHMDRPPRMHEKYDYRELSMSGVHIICNIKRNIYCLVKWNKSGLKYFAGQDFDCSDFQKYLRALALQNNVT